MVETSSERRFEVSARREGRWVIDCLRTEEAEARARAEELYADEGIEAVRIMRGRFGHDGLVYETAIHEQERPPRRGAAPVRMGRRPSEEAWCETFDELYGSASRRAIARLLRNFLDRHGITPTELLHHHRYIRLLERQDTLGPQAIQNMATLQAAKAGSDPRERLDTLTRFAADAGNRARDALTSRGAPRVGDGGLEALARNVAAAVPAGSEHEFYLRFAISVAFETLGDPAEKLTQVLDWTDNLPDALVPLIDELVAGLLGSAGLVQHLLGPQSHLAAALSALADLVQGRVGERATPLLARLAQLVSERALPETRLELLDRIARELGGTKPLSRDDDLTQRRSFDALIDLLSGPDGLILGGPPMADAIARRARRFGIVGGVEEVRLASTAAPERLEQLLTLASGICAARQRQAFATHLAALLDEAGAPPCEPTALRARIAAIPFSDEAKAALLARLPAGAAGPTA